MTWTNWAFYIGLFITCVALKFPVWFILLPVWLPLVIYGGMRFSWMFLFVIIKLIF